MSEGKTLNLNSAEGMAVKSTKNAKTES